MPRFPAESPRETFTFGPYRWDITKAKRLVAKRPPDGHVPVVEAARMLGLVRVNEAHARTVDLHEPIIGGLVEDFVLPIDGWHRIWRAREDSVPELPIKVLTRAEQAKCLLAGPGKRRPR